MPDTEALARLRLRTEQRIKVIMAQAKKREALYLARAAASDNRKAHYMRLAADEIRLAQALCEELLHRLRNIQDMKSDRALKKLLGE